MSYGRMKEKQGQSAVEVAELLRKAREVDDNEDRRCCKDKRGDELPGGTDLPGEPVTEDKGGQGGAGGRGLAETEQA